MYHSACVHVPMDGRRVAQGWPSIAGGSSELANIGGVNVELASVLVCRGDDLGAGPLWNGDQPKRESPSDSSDFDWRVISH
ncbi:MAG: hypothetical protein DMG27_11345 [Acidobacteria bacterium]|nr:MAG: hypothetical protein DMG27_11345 [Acidobacteriota bacterium]